MSGNVEQMTRGSVDSIIDARRLQSVANTIAGKTVGPTNGGPFAIHDEVLVDVSQGDSAEQVLRKMFAVRPKGIALVIGPATPKSWSEIDGK